MKRRDLDTETDRYSGKPSCEREGRDEGDVSSSQRIPEMASKPPGSRTEAWKGFSFTYLRRNPPC